MEKKVYTILWFFIIGDLAVCTVTPENEMTSLSSFGKSGRMKRERTKDFDKNDEMGLFNQGEAEDDAIDRMVALMSLEDMRSMLVMEIREQARTTQNEELQLQMLGESLELFMRLNDAIVARNTATDENGENRQQENQQQNRRHSI